MRIACIGGGPAGLYFAILMKLRSPAHDIHVFERNRAGDTFGWGVVFSDQTLDNLKASDPVSATTIADSFAHWDDIAVTIDGQTITSSGHGFIGIGRKHLLQILQARATELGVVLHFESECSSDVADYADFDLIVASDGINSGVRNRYQDRLGVHIDERRNKFMWLGTHKLFDAFAFIFERTRTGRCGRMPIVSTTTPRPSSSNAAPKPGPGLASTPWIRTKPSRPARRCSRGIWMGSG